MSRVNLLSLQVFIAVISMVAWYVLTTVPIGGVTLLPPFFFSNPVDVGARVVKWFADGTIWKHLWITLIATDLEPGALQPGMTRDELIKALDGHAKGAAGIIGTFSKP